jgi:predicted transcriptional regulator
MRVKPYWAALIRDGSKTVELRRQRSGCEPGTTVVIYTSFPVKQVQAVASVKRVHALAPEELWRAVGPQSAVAYEDFMAYLGDLEVAYGIELTDLREVAPFALARSGPQSWSYLFADEPAAAAVLAACQLELT